MKVKTITTTEIDSKHKGVFEFAIVPAQLLSSSEDIVVEGGFLLVKTTPSLKVSPKLIVVAKFVDDLKDEYLLLKKVKRFFCNRLEVFFFTPE